MVDRECEADDRDGLHRTAGLDNPGQRRSASIEYDALLMKVLAGVTGQSEFREKHYSGVAFRRLAHQGDRLFAVESRIGDAHGRDGDRDADHVVIVKIKELLARSHVCRLDWS